MLEQALAHSEEAHGVKQSVPGLRGLLHAAKSAIKIDGSQQLSIQDPLYSIFASDIDRTAVQADRDRHSDGGDSAHVVTRDVLAQKQTLLVWWQRECEMSLTYGSTRTEIIDSGDDIMKGTYRTIDDDRIWIPAMSKWTQGLYDQRSNYSVEDDGEQTDLPAVESMLSVLDYYINNFEGLTINSLPGVKPLVRPSMLPAERVAYVSQVIVDSREENNKQEDMIWLNRELYLIPSVRHDHLPSEFGADVFEKNGSDLLSYCKRGDENILSHGARAESIGERVRTAYFEVHAAAMDESLDEDRFHGIRVAGVHSEILSQLGGLINLYNKAKSTSAPSSPELTFRRLE